jgi:signal transduction histidine kinase
MFSLMLLLMFVCLQTSSMLAQSPSSNPPSSPQSSPALDSLKAIVRSLEQQQRSDTTLVRALNELAYEALDYELDSVPKYCNRAQTLAQTLDDKRGMAQMLNNLGLWFRIKSKYDSAFATLVRALRLSENNRFHDEQMMALSFLCLVHFDRKDFPQAVVYAHRILATNRANPDDTWTTTAYNNLGAAYRKMTMYDSALFYLNKTYLIRLSKGNKKALVPTLINMASVLESQGKLDSAVARLNTVLTLNAESNDRSSMIYTSTLLARVQSRKSDYASALASIQHALATADSIGFVPEKPSMLALLADIHEARGEHKQALAAQKQSSILRDSLNKKEVAENIATISAQYESEKKEQQIRLLTADKALQTTIQRALVALGVVLLLAVATLVSRYRLKARNEEALRTTNDEILRQKDLLEEQAATIELANTELQERHSQLERTHDILEEQAREIEIANTTLQEKNLHLEELMTEKNEFLGIAAHDLKNPLTTVKMNASMIRSYRDKISGEKLTELAERIESTADRMHDIVASFLDINALESGQFAIERETFAIVPLVLDLVNEYNQKSAAKNIYIHLETSNKFITKAVSKTSNEELSDDANITDIYAYADKRMTISIIENLVSNAVKFSPPSSTITVLISNTPSSATANTQHTHHSQSATNRPPSGIADVAGVWIDVRDNGPGILDEDKPKLFGKFSRLTARPTAGEHSTGLGLSIVKKMVNAMHGTITCASEASRGIPGATFTVMLPAQQS